MVFSSVIFLFFFLPVTLLVYYLVPRSWRNGVLLISSLLFYAWGEVTFVFVMLASTLMNYFFARLIDATKGDTGKKFYLILGIVLNLALLGFFKYLNFFIDNINTLSGQRTFDFVDIAVPIGISFFTFQFISYLVDLYRSLIPVEKNPLRLILYTALFPHLLAGPILRYIDLAPQLKEREVTTEKFALGIRRFIIGLGKKVLIANTLAGVSDQIFALEVVQIGTTLSWLGLICYTLQIFYDFSGYSDMAVGLGKMFGFDFAENFDYPYVATSIRDFWRRWHMTLSSWIRDYMFMPLSRNVLRRTGGKHSRWVQAVCNFVVMVLVGLWHGASWNFVIWGALHGFYMSVESALNMRVKLPNAQTPRQHLMRVGRILITLALVMFAWLFFRIETLPDALAYLGRMFSLTPDNLRYTTALYLDSEILLVLVLGIFFAIPFKNVFRQSNDRYGWFPVAQNAALAAIFVLALIYTSASTYNPFIYFRF